MLPGRASNLGGRVGDNRRRLLAALAAAALALIPLASPIVLADGLAVDDTYSVAEDTPGGLIVTADTGVLANDTGGSATLCVSSYDASGLQGTLETPPGLAPDGSFIYTPPENFNGTTTLTYEVATKSGDACPVANEGTATVTITVTPVNDPPTANNDSFSALTDHTLNVVAPGVLGNDSDIDGDPLTAVLASGPGHGVVTLAADGGFSYTPKAGYSGPDAFSYQAFDGTATSQTRAVSLTVTAVPPPPTPTPAPTPTPVPPTATPEPSPSESPLPTESALPTLPVETLAPVSPTPSAAPVSGPTSSSGGLPIVAIGALALLLGLLAIAAVYFIRSQASGGDGDVAYEAADEDGGDGPAD
jgi:Bacterial Ig domain